MSSLARTCLIFALTWGSAAVAGESENRYGELLTSEATAKTVKSLGMAIVALPHQHDAMTAQIERYFWTRQADVKLEESVREVEEAKLRRQLEAVETLVKKHDLRRLELAGFTPVGTLRNLDLYYAADTPQGPVVIRVSVSLLEAAPRVFEFRLFEGWQQARSGTRQIEHKPGKAVASVTYTPPAPPAAPAPQ